MLSLTVHLWSLVLPPPEWVRVALLALLSADERARMGAFLVDEPRYTFGVTRGLLRRVLSWHCPEVAPMGWMFTPDANGKPYARWDLMCRTRQGVRWSRCLIRRPLQKRACGSAQMLSG
jgi:hypothetical protein